MKKQGKKTNNSNKNKNKRSKTYQLDDYRNKKQQSHSEGYRNPYDNPYDNVTGQNRRSNQNPYRKQYQEQYRSPKDMPRRQQASYESYTQQTYMQQTMPSPEERRQEIKKNNKLSRKDALKHKKRQRKRFIRRLLAIGCVAMFGTYGIIKCMDLVRYPSISYQVVREGTIDNGKEREGLIVRDETVIKGQKEGSIHYIVGEGEKVAKNGQVCFVANDEELLKTLEAMTTLDENIYNIQDKRSEYSYFQSEIHLLNKEIKDEMSKFYGSRYWNQPGEVYSLRKQLERVIQNRTDVYINDKSQLTEEMQTNRTELQNQLKNYKNVVHAQQAGIVSYTVDGYEGLNFQTAEQVNLESYKKAMKDAESLNMTTNAYAGVDTPLYKLVQDHTWKIITYMTIEEAANYEVGKQYNFYFEEQDDVAVPFKLENVVEDNGQMRCIFTSNEKLVSFLATRHVNFVIGQTRAEGLKIPLKAIVEKNIMPIPNAYIVEEGRHKSVLKVNGSEVQLVTVDAQYSDDEYTYIMQQIDNAQAIQLGQVIKHPTEEQTYTLSEIDPVQGVYVINGSYAKFKRIGIAMTNEDSAILQAGTQTTVKEFDQIISNPGKIKEDQLLKYMDVKNQ